MSHKKNFVKKGQVYRSLVATALIANGVFQFIAPVLAEGSAGGQTIDNTATATYEDPNNPGETINTTSNTVEVTVAEVAGITVTPAGTEFQDTGDVGGDGKINVGDELYYNYTVTNVGNDPTQFRIPDQPTVTGPATLDGDVEINYQDGNGWQPVAQGGTTTNSVNPDESVLVRVPVKVEPGAVSGDIITVKLGETPGDDQNIPRDSNGGDVYTVDNGDGDGVTGEVPGLPANGVREASASLEAIVDSDLKTYTLAKVLKVRSDHTVAGNPGPEGDTVTYDLSLEVENTDPTGNGISPAPLEGTSINLDSTVSDNILVSDAIPVGTKLSSVVAPSGWTAVYTTSAVGTFNANAATWTTTPPGDLATVRRVGFIRTGSIAPGQTVNGFKVTVEVTSTDTSVTVANVAQLFGESPNDAPVYDESGDNNPSNYNDDGTPFDSDNTDTDNDNIPDTLPDNSIDGSISDPRDADEDGTLDADEDPGDVETDKQNNNTGTGAGGEANVFTISQVGATSLLNGPKDSPDAVAENDNNKDFTNQSSLVPAGTVPGTADDPGPGINPDGVSFTNTVKNTGVDPDPTVDTDGNGIANIVLEPIAPDTATDLPDGTVVTVTYDSQLATYTYTYDETTDVGSFTLASGTPVKISGVAPNATENYGVEVNLPDGTRLSTDTDIERGYPVPIRAFVDNDGDNTADDDGNGNPAENITIDRVYVGYLQMVKETRVLQGESTTPVTPGDENFSIAPKTPATGHILEYRITYKNISEPQSGTDNIILNASDIRITEDGTATIKDENGEIIKNNWALDNDENGEIDTSNISGSATDSGGANIEFTPNGDQTGTTASTDVTRYMVIVSDDVAPQEMRTFTFQRRINGTGLTGTATTPTP